MILDWLFPPRCLVCHSFMKVPKGLCAGCLAKWPVFLPRLFILPEAEHCRRVCAAGIYRGLLHDLVIRLKYRKEERLAWLLGDRMTEMLDPETAYDLILPVPLHSKRLKERGFNQALLLARRIGKRRGILVDPFLLEKRRMTPSQAGLSADGRRKNLKDAFELRDSDKVKGKKILIVDDVYTTGTTIEAAARLLLKAGAEEITALVAARTE